MPPGLVRLPNGKLVPRGSAAQKAYQKKHTRPNGTSDLSTTPAPKPPQPKKTPAPPRASSAAPKPTGPRPKPPKPDPRLIPPASPIPGLAPAPIFGPLPAPHPTAPPPPTDWRQDPGGGYVDVRSGRRVAIPRGPQEDKARAIVNDTRYSAKDRAIARRYLKAYSTARVEQQKAFEQTKAFEREAALRMPPGMRERWASEFDAQMAANPEKYGLPPEHRPWWKTPGIANDIRWAKEAGRIGAGIGKSIYGGITSNINEFTTGLAAGGRGRPEMAAPIVGRGFGERGMETVAGKALTNALLHGDLHHPAAIALEALMLPIPLKGAPMVATALARVGAAVRIARTAETGADALSLAARAVNMTAKERKALRLIAFENVPGTVPEDTRRLFLESKARESLWQTVRQGAGRKAADAYIRLADARAYSVHRQISSELSDRIAALDAKVAAGTATEQDIAMRKELGMMQRFGVPADWYYTHLHESGSGIPDWIQARYQAKRPEIDWQFKFEGPARGGENYGKEAISKRLAAKLNPKNALRGLPQNPAVEVNGLHVVGPISDESWLKRVLSVMPSKEERTYWATWYKSFEPLFRQAFGADADAIMRGFAASQANTSPSGGLGATLKVMDRIRRGEPVTNEGIGQVAMAIQDAVKGTPLEEGMAAKLSDFTDALAQMDTRTWMGHDLAGGAPAPSDIWAGRDLGHVDPKMVGYLRDRFGLREGIDFKVDSPGAPTGGRYERITEQYNRIADKLNSMEGGKGFDGHQWKPADVQALGWGAIQKFLGVNPEDIQYALARNAWDVATEATQGVTGIGAHLTVEQAQHVASLFEPDLRRLIDETPGVYLLPGEEPFKFTTGGWAGGQNGSVQFKVIGSQRDVQGFLTRVAQAFDQEHVQAVRRTSSADAKPRSALVVTSDAFKNEADKQRFFQALAENSPESKPSRTAPKEPLLQGYARHDPVDGVESIVIRTHAPTATGKAVAPWLAKFEKAVKAAEDKTGIRVTIGHENLQMIVGGQHGAVDPLASVPGRSGGLATGQLDDRLAAGIRTRLEAAVRGITSGSPDAANGLDLLAHADDLESRITQLENDIERAIRDKAHELGGAQTHFASGGRVRKANREWVPGIGRRGAIGGSPGRYIEHGHELRGTTVRRTAWENAKRHAEDVLIAENGPVAKMMDELTALREERMRTTYPEWAQFAKDRQTGFLHGVHAYNGLPVTNEYGIPAGKSSVFISENTPMPARIMSHEEMGHYVDQHILPQYPKAKAIVEDLLSGLSTVDRAETFAHWAEEYTLMGGGPNLPSELKAPMRDLANHALEETAAYSALGGRAAARVYIPPEIVDVFDAIHGWEGLTGQTYIPGKTTWEKGVQALAETLGKEEIITPEQATQAIRYLRAGEKVQQIRGQARRNEIFRRAVEHIADRISTGLMNHETLLKAGPVWRASAAGRVSKAAAQELALDAERAKNAADPLFRALPKEASPSDVAHSLWAQLPAAQRNRGGLTLVRDKMASELEQYTSGRKADEILSELEDGKAALKTMESGSPEYFAQMEQNGKLRALLTDLPFIEKDLATQIATLDNAIAADPQLDPKVIDALDKIGRSREKVLLEAGAPGADQARFDNRRGLLSQWLGLDPTGEEIYLGHRMGTVTGAPGDLVPQAVGAGKPTTPQGLSRANNLVLANTGRMRMSTHVAYEDWNRAQAYKFALRQRADYAKLGHVYDGGRLPEGSILVNPKAKPTPKGWKTDPFNIAEGDEAAIEQAATQMLKEFAANADDPEAVAALKKAAHDNSIPMSDLRVVTKQQANHYSKQFMPYKYTRLKGELSAYDHAVNVMSANLIFLRLGYIPKNIVQNLVMVSVHQGPRFLVNAPRAAQLLADPELRRAIAVETGGGAAKGVEREMTGSYKHLGRAADVLLHKPAAFVTAVADNPLRASAFVHELANEGVIPKLTTVLRPEDKQAILAFLTDESKAGRQRLNRVTQRMRDHMGDFNRMTPYQRRVARRALIIPGWLLAGSRYPIYFAMTHPLRSLALAYLAAGMPGADKLGLPQTPDIGQRFVRYGYNEGFKIGNKIERTTSISPVNTPYDLLMGVFGKDNQKLGGNLNPLIQGAWNVGQLQTPYGKATNIADAFKQNFIDQIFPDISFVEGMIHPSTKGTYPEDVTRLGRLKRELGIIPIEITPGGSSAKRSTDEWQKKVKEARANGIPLPPDWPAAVAAKGLWQSERAKRGKMDKVEEARAKFDILVKVKPQYKGLRKQFEQALQNPNNAGSLIRTVEGQLGWTSLTTMSGLTSAKKRQKGTP